MNRDINIAEALKRIQKVRENRFYHLDLSRLGLKEIPEDISDLNYLMELDLSYNAFSSMPEMVAKMKNLRVLDLSDNQIMDINFIYGENYSFQELNISNNYLYHIPESIEYLSSDTEIIFDNVYDKYFSFSDIEKFLLPYNFRMVGIYLSSNSLFGNLTFFADVFYLNKHYYDL